ncbi:nicotinamide riboside transporter PnuC [Lewinella sp. W8]|uniref:nicotinamide riboside transporter PnuC n=1 Tax=Lewinella sp. W8 TaxID=2528208 RepID=UPI001067285F|nr:nicotinamide riboside transporter PnuC [Lewinella sp. W8]MTB53618.1 nicotinamide riboside transporter PnuC [Lewinella sp. W8]
MDTLLEQLIAQTPLDWIAVATGLLYVWLAARDNNWCWLFAAISTAAWAYQSFFVYALVSDALLQVFYFIMAGVGLWRWRRAETPGASAPIISMPLREHLLTVAGSLLGGLALGYGFSQIMTAAATYPDAITTVSSVLATFLLIGRRLENWLYWVVIDLAYVWIYLSQGAVLFAVLMGIYTVMALYGYLSWRRELR